MKESKKNVSIAKKVIIGIVISLIVIFFASVFFGDDSSFNADSAYNVGKITVTQRNIINSELNACEIGNQEHHWGADCLKEEMQKIAYYSAINEAELTMTVEEVIESRKNPLSIRDIIQCSYHYNSTACYRNTPEQQIRDDKIFECRHDFSCLANLAYYYDDITICQNAYDSLTVVDCKIYVKSLEEDRDRIVEKPLELNGK